MTKYLTDAVKKLGLEERVLSDEETKQKGLSVNTEVIE